MKSKVSVRTFRKWKNDGEKIAMLTVYDAPTARIAHESGADVLLVGDSLAMTVLGFDNTLPLTIEESLHHTRAARRGAPQAFIIGDMPFMSYQVNPDEAVRNAAKYLQLAHANAVKIEGGAEVAPLVARLVDCGIPVMPHIGLLPQRIMASGGYRVAGRDADEADELLQSALALQEAGAFALVLECMPSSLAEKISRALVIPTIGIGSGIGCDGQVQVINDILGLFDDFSPKHSRRYAEIGKTMHEAIAAYTADVKTQKFPGPENSF